MTLGLYNPQETLEVINGKCISCGGTWSTSHITEGKNQFAHVKVFTEKCSWNTDACEIEIINFEKYMWWSLFLI